METKRFGKDKVDEAGGISTRKSKSFWKKTTGLLAGAAIGVFMAVGLSAPAHASGDWGGSEGEVGGNMPSGQWHTIYPGNGQSAWERYSSRVASAYTSNPASFLRDYRNMNEGMIQICRNADFIWWWGYDPSIQGLTHLAANGNTHNTSLPTQASNRNGRAANSEEWTAWLQTGQTFFNYNGSTSWQQGRMDMICANDSWMSREVTVPETENRVQDVDPIERTGVAFMSSNISPGINFSGDIGDTSLEHQNLTNRTPYGEIVQEVANGEWDSRSHSALLTAVDRALDESDPFASSSPASVNTALTSRNQRALSEGGVLNVTESHRMQPIELERSQDQRRSREVTYRCGPGESPSAGECDRISATPWSSWANVGDLNEDGARAGNLESFRSHGAFQILGVRCNAEDFNLLANEVDGLETYSGGTGQNFSGGAYTPTQNLSNGSSPRWTFGNPNHSNEVLAATGTLNFYTRECNTQCLMDDVEAISINSAEDGRSVNDVIGDVRGSDGYTANTERNDLIDFGEGLGLLANNNETYFDFTVPNVRQNGGIVDATPVQTVVERWDGGSLGVTQENGTFAMRAYSNNGADNTRLFRGDDDIRIRNDGSFTAGHNSTVSVLDGIHNVFGVQGNWATDSDAPEVVNVSYVYEIDLRTSTPTAVRTGGASGASGTYGRVSGNSVHTNTIYSRCFTDGARSISSVGLPNNRSESEVTGAEYSYTGNQGVLSDIENSGNTVFDFYQNSRGR